MTESYNVTIPPLLCEFEEKMTILSEANNSDHWTKKRKRRIDQQLLIRAALFDRFFPPSELPLTIVLTRMYPRTLDYDNLVHAFKGIRDEIASFLSITENKSNILVKNKGFFDSDLRMQWEYKQEKSKLKGVKIQIYKV